MRRTQPLHTNEVRVGKSRTGLGLFATNDLSPGRYIEYTGKHLTSEEADQQPNARYLFEVNSRITIDGSTRDNIARYINHSCKPNCEALVQGKRVFIKVLRHIPSGAELTYDYGKEYVEAFITPNGCRCDACTTATH